MCVCKCPCTHRPPPPPSRRPKWSMELHRDAAKEALEVLEKKQVRGLLVCDCVVLLWCVRARTVLTHASRRRRAKSSSPTRACARADATRRSSTSMVRACTMRVHMWHALVNGV
jgi:hypothetical protein